MKKLILIACFLISFSSAPAAINRNEVLAAIQKIESDPVSVSAYEASSIIVKFTEESDAVTVNVSTKITPWIDEKWNMESSMQETISGMLLAAYIGGNIKNQLTTGKNTDDPYSGWLLVFRVYEKYREKIDFRSESIEQMMELHAKGLLKSHALKILTTEANQALQRRYALVTFRAEHGPRQARISLI